MDISDPGMSVLYDAENYDWLMVPAVAQTPQGATHDDSEQINTAGSVVEDPTEATDHWLPKQSPTQQSREERLDTFMNESADSTLLRLSNEFAPIVEAHADTLVYIGCPPQTSNQDDHEYQHIKQKFEIPFLMHSTTLRKMNCAKFEKVLGPMSARTERKLKKRNVHKLVPNPERIKFYVDLSPVIDDDEALIQVTELTVPSGALSWHKHAKDLCIPAAHVCGRDQFNFPPRSVYRMNVGLQHDLDDAEQQLGVGEPYEPKSPKGQKPKERIQASSPEFDYPEEEEYSLLRHHTTIVRLLHAMVGQDPKLNSAAKMWSFCMLAKYYDIAQNPLINPWIMGWLLQNGNMNFIQINPSISYRLAIATESVWLTRTSFAMLVGQQAILQMADEHFPEETLRRASYPCHLSATLDDDEINRIDHAASALVQHTKRAFVEMVEAPEKWVFMAPSGTELAKINAIESEGTISLEILKSFKIRLMRYIRRRVYQSFDHLADGSAKQSDLLQVVLANRTFSVSDTPGPMLLLTRPFWERLRRTDFAVIEEARDSIENRTLWPHELEKLKSVGLILNDDLPYVSKKDVFNAVDELNSLLIRRSSFNNYGRLSKTARIVIDNVQDAMEQAMSTEDNNHTGRNFESLGHQLSSLDDTLEAKHVDADEELFDFEFESLSIDDGTVSGNPNLKGTSIDLSENTAVHVPEALTDLARDADADADTETMLKVGHKAQPNKQYVHPNANTNTNTKLPPKPRLEDQSGKLTIQSTFRVTKPNVGPQTTPPAPPQRDLMTDKPLPRHRYVFGRANSNLKNEYHRPIPQLLHNGNRTMERAVHAADKFEALEAAHHLNGTFVSNLPISTRESQMNQIILPTTLLQELSARFVTQLESLGFHGSIQDKLCDFDIPTDKIQTLLRLSEEEWKYLPLWADGLDDGTGGVFDDGVEIPDAPEFEEGGFRGGAIGIIPGVGSSIGGSRAGSGFEDVGTESGASTVGKASRLATDGTRTVVSLDE